MRRSWGAALGPAGEARLAGRGLGATARGPQGPVGCPSRHQPPSDGHRTKTSTEGRKSPFADPHLAHLVRKELPWGVSLAEGSILEATQRPASRFLKQKATSRATGGSQQAGPDLVLHGGLGAAATSASKGRPCPLLWRVAQIERRIQSRRAQQGEVEAAVRLAATLDAAIELSLSESSSCDSEQRAGGHQWHMKKGEGKVGASRLTNAPLQDPAKVMEGLSQGASEEEEAAEAEDASELWPGRKRASRIPPSPPAQWASLGARSRRSPSSPPSLEGSLSADPTTEGPSPYERSIVRSLDELFSEAADAHSSNISGSDFRMNILSLDDLVPSQEEEKGTPLQAAGKPGKELGAALYPPPAAIVTTESIFSSPKASNGKELTSEEEKLEEEEAEELGEMASLERLDGHSAALPSSSGKDETPGDADYSEDFEPSSSFGASEAGEEQFLTSSELQNHSEASLQSSQSGSSSLQSPQGSPASTKPCRRQRTVKEAAVQTSSFPLLPQWWQTDVPIIGLALGGGCTVDAVPVGSPTLSLDALEALTAYSPAAFALNEMLKENLLLIRQFAEANHRLHTSLVASLEEEEFHYHTLEETQRYIKNHKAPPLTMEQALQEMAEQEEVSFWNPQPSPGP
ncbi:hypothetical protein JD844_033899 [Phrynosoma platyrhinos]|uniref:DUF4614 domain-containing protein n=1 Tax=Phrynosoma platyrhinos TaxID=52577 RepID=A0ABQ7T8B3_PHRPL|nr:hypothetical protein JD844_033899 [Phrynosoma platyrhinos]